MPEFLPLILALSNKPAPAAVACAPATDVALYIHWPFCLSKCPYCDFNSHVREAIDEPRFAAALHTELAFEAARLGPRRLTSIFFGGGTPSLMSPATVAALIAAATRHFPPAPGLEITLEANPTSVEAARLSGYADAGVNRISLGIQSLDPEALAGLGRQHSAPQAIAALHLARRLFSRVSFDLIYARPGQTLPAWEQELTTALSFGCDHFSLYQLTIEPNTVFAARHRRGELALPEDDIAAAMYHRTNDIAAAAGLHRYEISNYARPGAESRHNLAYWRYNDYLGIGPGAHGRLTLQDGTRIATRRHRAPEPWADRVEATGHGSTAEEILDPSTRAREALLMGLRLTEGIDPAHFARRTGQPLAQSIDQATLRQAIDEGYVSYTPERLRALPEGLARLDALLAALAA